MVPAALLGLAALAVAPALSAQAVVTAERFFDRVSETYGGIVDYEADIRITQGDTVMEGALSYKRPNLLRIDFSRPAGQVLVSDGRLLTIYYPDLEVIFEQTLRRPGDDGAAGLASRQGLHFLKSNYAIAYVVGPDPVPLDGPAGEPVVKLMLTSRSATEGFRQLELAVAAGNLIRRISGITVGFEEHRFDFFNVRTNQNIPDTRFAYDSPPFANVYRDFLFESDE